MSDYYHHQYLASMAGGGGNPDPNAHEVHQHPIPGVSLPMASSPMTGGPMQAAFSGIGYFTAFHDPVMFTQQKTQRSRRKSASGLDAVKHRRTRSGCFMCRSRRVKCDETRPICERCKKGNRECIYPELSTSKGSSSKAASKEQQQAAVPQQTTSPGSSNDAEEDESGQDVKLEPILDEDEEEELAELAFPDQGQASVSKHTGLTSPISLQRVSGRQNSETPSVEGNKSSPATSEATSGTTTYHASDPMLQAGSTLADWSNLPPDIQYYLGSFCENINHYHYCMINDPDGFYSVILPNIAIRNEALLNAIVGFAAYHETLKNPSGKLEDFLKYYNKSVMLLLDSLKKHEPQTITTLLTVLQLATIEEYLGDWINLMGHQKAALQILTNLFTPETAMKSPAGRMIVAWYSRFDVFLGIMGGFRTALPREWFTVFVDFCKTQIASTEDNLQWKLEEASANLRLLSMDMSMLFAQGSRGEISPEEFMTEHDMLLERLHEWKDNMDPDIINPVYAVTHFPHGQDEDEDNIVDPHEAGILYEPPCFSTTLLNSEWHSIVIMHKCQSSTRDRMSLYGDLRMHSYKICQIFEAVERWPGTPKGGLILIQACIAISALFLPQDRRHHNWIRKKFALIETLGYIHPITLRSKMGELFGDPSCVTWWLPNDDRYTPILRNIRAFADERNAAAMSAQTENLREVRHVFAKMQLIDSEEAVVAASGGHGQ